MIDASLSPNIQLISSVVFLNLPLRRYHSTHPYFHTLTSLVQASKSLLQHLHMYLQLL